MYVSPDPTKMEISPAFPLVAVPVVSVTDPLFPKVVPGEAPDRMTMFPLTPVEPELAV